jgi:hypothetical protein
VIKRYSCGFLNNVNQRSNPVNVFFNTNVDRSLVKLYRWVPIAYFSFVATVLGIVLLDIPELDGDISKIDLMIVAIAVFSGSILMFCVQALARIESRLIENNKCRKN